jgi:metal-responsive CopG/Arc/MetJ family transcriptional regulator
MPTTSLRLPSHLTESLDRLARERGTTRSELIREAVDRFLADSRSGGPSDRVALLRSLVSYAGSGRGDLAARSEDYLREIVGGRRRDRSR